MSNSAPSDIKITDIKCGYIRNGHSLFVKIYTNQDVWGCGEGVDATPGTYHLVKMMGQRIKNQSPPNVHRLFEQLRKGGFFEGAQSGMYVAVLSAIESALWDLAGKILGLPIYQLLGGKFRDRIRVYMDTALYQSTNPKPEEFATAAKKAVEMGFNAIKFDVDQANDPNKYDRYNWTASPAELQRMVDQISAARQAVGPKIDICVDMHGKYDAPTGEKVAKLFEPLNLMWLEEPVPAENPKAYKKIADSLCCGRSYLSQGLVDEARQGAERVMAALAPALAAGAPIVGLEPSCLLALRDEFYSLSLGPAVGQLSKQVFLFEEFLMREGNKGLSLPLKPLPGWRAVVHGHCHQKALAAIKSVRNVLGWIPGFEFDIVDASCCGMSGSFGLEAEHYEASVRMGELALLPAVRAAAHDAVIVADGFSCRHQIRDGSGREAVHVAVLLARALA